MSGSTPPKGPPFAPSLDFERALRLATLAHQGQARRGSGTPYIEHPLAVALILDRAGFGEDVAIAGLLHDVAEDTDVTPDRIACDFGPTVAALVAHASEIKLGPTGAKRPWLDRKRDHVDAVRSAPDEAKGLVLADKLHNLLSIRLDLLEGRPIWDAFHAPRADVLRYYAEMIDACRSDDPRVAALADEAREHLATLAGVGDGNREIGALEG